MENLKPYDQYKDSGLAWLGKIPKGSCHLVRGVT